MDPYKEDPTLLGGLLESIRTGLAHSYGQVRDDFSSLLEGRYNPGTASRMFDVVSELPLGQMAKKTAGLAERAPDVVSGIWGPIRSKEQKKAVSAMWRADPEAVRAVGTDPRVLNVQTPTQPQVDLMASFGRNPNALATYSGNTGLIVSPTTMKGRDPRGGLQRGKVNLPETMLHEGTHFLNEPRIYGANVNIGQDPNMQATSEMLYNVFPYLKPYARSAATTAAIRANDPRLALDEALAYLSMPSARAPDFAGRAGKLHELLKIKAGEPGTTRGIRLTPENLTQARAIAREQDQASLFADIFSSIKGMLEKGPSRDVLGPKLTADELAMYNKMSPGSAAPDIPRPTSSPGALEHFEALRKKLGLPEPEGGLSPEFYGKNIPERDVTFNKFKGIVGEEEIPGIMKELQERYINRSTPAEKMRSRDASMRLWGRAGPGPDTADDFIKAAIDLGSQGMGASDAPPVWGKAPLRNLRRSLYPDYKLFTGGGFNKEYSERQRLSPEQLAAFGYTLTKGGVLEGVMEDMLRSPARRGPPSNPNAMQNLRRLEQFVETAVRPKGQASPLEEQVFSGMKSGLKGPERDVTFNKFSQGEKKGGTVLKEMLERVNKDREESAARFPGLEKRVPLSADTLVSDTLTTLGNNMGPTFYFGDQPLLRGISGFRRQVLGSPQIMEHGRSGSGYKHKLSVDDTIALLQHLDKSGLLNNYTLSQGPLEHISEGVSERHRIAQQLDQSRLDRLSRLLEDTRQGPGTTTTRIVGEPVRGRR